mmetsp:Transcript_3493/g.8042  ORF Transcript_3493/g.8042 Transcript_3493/m.8042 type:complete len:184 (-) Transcript_3493:45-596(-)
MTMMNMLSVMPIIILVTMTMVGGACAFAFNDPSRSMLAAPRAPLDTRCVANTAGDSKWYPQSSSRANSPHLGHSRRLESLLFARRRRGSSADDEDDEYDDDYIDDLINEKFDDDFDDDDDIDLDGGDGEDVTMVGGDTTDGFDTVPLEDYGESEDMGEEDHFDDGGFDYDEGGDGGGGDMDGW